MHGTVRPHLISYNANGIGFTPNLQYTNERNGGKLFSSPLWWDLTHPHGEKGERLLEEANALLLVTVKRICRRSRGFENINKKMSYEQISVGLC